MVAFLAPIAAAAAALLSAYVMMTNCYYAQNACDRLTTTLNENVVGQPLGTRLITKSICEHLRQNDDQKPLILSVHGPPCVGKTHSHVLAAHALYGLTGSQDTTSRYVLKSLHSFKHGVQRWVPLVQDIGYAAERYIGNPMLCPGGGCPAYKVFYGEDYLHLDTKAQHHMIRASIIAHARKYPESLFVFEEFDKAHCETRMMLRQLLSHPEIVGISLRKAIFILEHNEGLFPIQNLLLKGGYTRESDSDFDVHHMLKEHMIQSWRKKSDCGGSIDVVKFGNLIDLYIAYFPLERSHLKDLILNSLQSLKESMPKGKLTWTNEFLEHCLKVVNFDGAFAIDGAKDSILVLRNIYHSLTMAMQSDDVRECSEDQLKFVFDFQNNAAVVIALCDTRVLRRV